MKLIFIQIKETIVMQLLMTALLLKCIDSIENKINITTNIKTDRPITKFTEIIKITPDYRLFTQILVSKSFSTCLLIEVEEQILNLTLIL